VINVEQILKFSFILGGVGIILTVLSGFLFCSGVAYVLGIVSVIFSILLSMGAMLYTYISGKETLKLLQEIETQNTKLVAKINQDLLKDAYDEAGIDAARERSPFRPDDIN